LGLKELKGQEVPWVNKVLRVLLGRQEIPEL
jgi:hypothetical protein